MMLCTYCNTYRPANEAPCPQCGGPSSLVGGTMGGFGASSPASGTGWGAQSFAGGQQGGENNPSLWAQVMAPEMLQQQNPFPQAQEPERLPVPYQGMPGQSLMVMPGNPMMGGQGMLPMIPQVPGPLVPAIPTEEEAVYIPPMYTKPRSIIPRYRAVSGVLSFLIVLTVLCSGSIYFANATGRLAFLHQLFGNVPPTSIASGSGVNLADPLPAENGPAYAIINSATTASKIDLNTAIALQPSQVFKPGQIIYLTYSVHPKTKGVVTFKWYTNNVLYKTITSDTIQDAKNGYFTMQYTQSLEGKVELYWNDNGTDQLAIRLYFVVR